MVYLFVYLFIYLEIVYYISIPKLRGYSAEFTLATEISQKKYMYFILW